MFCYSQDGIKYWIDNNGKSISSQDFRNKWTASNAEFARWDHFSKDSSRVAKLSHPIGEIMVIKYDELKNHLTDITHKQFSDSTVFLIEFYFKDDYCTGDLSNKWGKSRINDRKFFLDDIKRNIKRKNDTVVYLVFFEKGIKLANKINEDEYFYSDSSNFLKEKIFKNPTLCGSFSLTKPNGNTFIRNGEFRADWMVEFLKEENWSLVFKE